jgi:hypothetical protein
MVMDGDALDGVTQKKGHVLVNFFVTNEVSSLKDCSESIRPFGGGKVDDVISKHKKKRNTHAIQVAKHEEAHIIKVRNNACLHYATKAFGVVNHRGLRLLGRRIEIHRPDVNYPYGDTIVGTVRQYSLTNKKWLVAFELSAKTKSKYLAAWINLANTNSKECSSLKVLDKKRVHEPTEYDLLPYICGFECVDVRNSEMSHDDELISKLMKERCRACADHLSHDHKTIVCSKCGGAFHIGCIETDNTPGKHTSDDWICSRCTPCKGCWQYDVAFGVHIYSSSSSDLTLPGDTPLLLCSLCTSLYERKQYCPNCCHTWDDERYQRVHSRSYNSPFIKGGGGRGRRRKNSDDDISEELEMDPGVPVEADWYHPDTTVWGYTAGNMLGCDDCGLWVHAGCSGLSREDYDRTSSGKHPIYSKEFLCSMCCRKRCNEIVDALRADDTMLLFAMPVTEDVAPTYHDIIKKPMDLQTIAKKASEGHYWNYAWVREDFELMVLNALTFNSFHSKFWNEAKRFYHQAMDHVFDVRGKGAPPGMYKGLVDECFRQAEKEKKKEEQRTQQDETTEKKDLVAGAQVTNITLPPLRSPADLSSCIPFKEIRMKPVDAHFCSWMDSCFTCGSSGASDTMLFCVDCGEAFHAFCVSAPIHSMDRAGVSGWRCPNCKICEISGEVPQDELKMLYCEMCDRAFTTDLLDPPLKAAPEGLWICGQCVDCAACRNSSEKVGVSLKYWSRDPEKCYRCGGCKGLVEEYTKKRRCSVCDGIWRDDDDDIVSCVKCKCFVHSGCDPIAAKHLRGKRLGTSAGSEQFECIGCRRHRGPDIESGIMLRKQLHCQAWTAVSTGVVDPAREQAVSPEELYAQLCDEIDWRIRAMWTDEYMSVIEDGFTMVAAIKRRDLDPRVMIDKRLGREYNLPAWVSRRAARFLVFAEKSGWNAKTTAVKNIYSAQIIARMAAAYLRVNCRAFQLQESIEVRAHSRMLSLLNEPNLCGFVDIPTDPVRVDNDPSLILGAVEAEIPGICSQVPTLHAERDEPTSQSNAKSDAVEYILAAPVCGWNQHLDPSDAQYEWKDPRICCLCRTCGDDDGDNDRQVSDGITLARCGRLLPMKDGYWVHASCALWSSEVYEEPNDSLVYAMEKARSRGSQLKCFGCGRPGASVGCCRPNCSRNYHFPCAKASDAVFTTNQQMFCEAHRSSASEVLPTESIEHMKSLMIADEKKDGSDTDGKFCLRLGSLTIHSLGEIEQSMDGFHCEKYITPPGYIATRIFWSFHKPKKRTVYVLKIEKDESGLPIFSITPGDNPNGVIRERSAMEAYAELTQRYKETNRAYFSSGDLFSKLPAKRKHTKKAYGLNGPQFFGFGLHMVRRALESSPGVEAVVAPLSESSPSYRFAYVQPDIESVMGLQRTRAAIAAENALENSSGCARTEGMKAVAQAGGSGRITRALVRIAEQEDAPAVGRSGTDADEKKAKADRDSNAQKYKAMKAVPLDERLAARRSHIHGWGLFCKIDLPKDSMIVEYMGEVVRQCIADKREKAYVQSGIGSCYMFRLDLQRIVDATTIGCMVSDARFVWFYDVVRFLILRPS